MVDFKRSLADVTRIIKKPIKEEGIVLPAIGVTTGLILGGFASETMARALGYIGNKKAAVKTAVKLALGGLVLGAGIGFPGTSFLLYPAAIAIFGLIPLDWIDARWSGGIEGIAEKTAVVIRTWSMGIEKVQDEIAQLEKLATSPNTILETRGEVHFPFENTHTKAEVELRKRFPELIKNSQTPPEAMRAESPLDIPLSRS